MPDVNAQSVAVCASMALGIDFERASAVKGAEEVRLGGATSRALAFFGCFPSAEQARSRVSISAPRRIARLETVLTVGILSQSGKEWANIVATQRQIPDDPDARRKLGFLTTDKLNASDRPQDQSAAMQYSWRSQQSCEQLFTSRARHT